MVGLLATESLNMSYAAVTIDLTRKWVVQATFLWKGPNSTDFRDHLDQSLLIFLAPTNFQVVLISLVNNQHEPRVRLLTDPDQSNKTLGL